jgi:micrococcal nuclease
LAKGAFSEVSGFPSGAAATPATSMASVGALPAGAEPATIVGVIEGDTLEVEVGGEQQIVRLNLIDTPEIGFSGESDQCLAREARDFTAALLPEGTTVWLERGVTEDQAGRLQRFVWILGDDGEPLLVNELLVREGYAFVLSVPVPELAHEERLREAEAVAYAGHRGIWGECAGTDLGGVDRYRIGGADTDA